MLLTKLLDRISGAQHLRDGILEAFQNGTGVTAKVPWLTNPVSEENRREGGDEGKPRWIHCTPLFGSDDKVGVWMVILVENEKVTGLLNRQASTNSQASTSRKAYRQGDSHDQRSYRGGGGKSSGFATPQPLQLGAIGRQDTGKGGLYAEYLKSDLKEDPTSYVDIKSNQLQEILIKVFKDVRGIYIREDKPTVRTFPSLIVQRLTLPQIEANLLYSFHREIKLCLSSMNEDPACSTRASYLQVLVDFIENTYEATHNRFRSHLRNRHITYDLLWALFKPNADIYTTCPGIEKPMCVRCNHGAEKTRANGSQYFCVEARQFDHDGKVFGEATVKIAIEKFRGAKRIDILNAFPLQYHRNSTDIRSSLLECGRKFVSLVGSHHHRRYEGQTFWRDEKGDIQHWFVNGRIIVDAVSSAASIRITTDPKLSNRGGRASGNRRDRMAIKKTSRSRKCRRRS